MRNQIGQQVYPVHRIDRKTAGLLLFAKTQAMNSQMQQLFMERLPEKSYVAIVRGHLIGSSRIDYDLDNGNGRKSAVTDYKSISTFEIPLSDGRFETSRYSYIQLKPITGRFHQLRKHLAHIRHPILGDRPHGCNKQNRLWKTKFNMDTMMLHAQSLSFTCPATNKNILIEAKPSEEFSKVLAMLNASSIVSN